METNNYEYDIEETQAAPGESAQPRRPSPYENSRYQNYQPAGEVPRYRAPKAEKRPVWKPILSGVVALAVVAGACGITGSVVSSNVQRNTQAMVNNLQSQIASLQATQNHNSQASISLPADGSLLTPGQLYSSCVNSVVAISTTVQSNSPYGATTGTASGSGFIFSEDGYIITNYHVVEGAQEITVNMYNGDSYTATEVGHDATNDLAVLKVEATGLSAAKIGSSDALNIGDMVVAIGNPLGKLASTQTVGYVSGINREVSTSSTILSMIQTDAAINPGNSGGPLFNMYGQVIGITTAKYSGSTSSGATIEGIGFAIPINDVMKAIGDLMEHGYVTSAYLGVTVEDMDEASASRYGLPSGAYVVSVADDGCAAKAGVQPKDIITQLGGKDIRNRTELLRVLREFNPGDSTTITVFRSGAQQTLTITLDERPKELDQTQTAPQSPSSVPDEYQDFYDFFNRFFGGR